MHIIITGKYDTCEFEEVLIYTDMELTIVHVLDRYIRQIWHLQEGRKRFPNDGLSTFYFQLYDVGHLVVVHLDNERGNPHFIGYSS